MSVKNEFAVSKRAVAYMLNCDERTVSRYQDREVRPLPVLIRNRTKTGNRYDPRAVMTWAVENELADLGVASDGEIYDYVREKGRLTKAQADKTELEVRELQGSLVPMKAVVAHWQGKISAARAKLLTLPSKLAVRIAPPDKIAEGQDLAQALIYEALHELAGSGIPPEIEARNEALARAQDGSPPALSDPKKTPTKKKH